MPFLSHGIRGTYYQCVLTTVDVDLDHLGEVLSVRFFAINLLFFPFPYSSLEESDYEQPTIKGGELCSISLRLGHLHQLRIILYRTFVYSPPTCLIMYLYQDRCMDFFYTLV